jgi:hypothetical protein
MLAIIVSLKVLTLLTLRVLLTKSQTTPLRNWRPMLPTYILLCVWANMLSPLAHCFPFVYLTIRCPGFSILHRKAIQLMVLNIPWFLFKIAYSTKNILLNIGQFRQIPMLLLHLSYMLSHDHYFVNGISAFERG